MPDSPEIYLIAQLLGFIGTIVVVISMQQKTYKNIAICKISNQLLAAMHYFLLGGYTGMVTNLVSCVTNGCYYVRIKKKKYIAFYCRFFCAFCSNRVSVMARPYQHFCHSCEALFYHFL